MIKVNGIYVIVGVPPEDVPCDIDLSTLVGNNATIVGSNIGSYNETVDMLNFSAEHNVVSICEFFKFADFPKAFAHLEKGKPHFRCVVNVEEWAKSNGFDKWFYYFIMVKLIKMSK